MFYVVEFEDLSVDVVPDSWLVDNGQRCFWPPARVSNIVACIKDKKCPEKSWKLYNIKRILKKCGKNSYSAVYILKVVD